MKNVLIFLFLFAFTCIFSFLKAEERNSLSSRNFSEKVFVTADSKGQEINKLLDLGVRAFIIDEKTPIAEMNRCFPSISKYLTEHSREIISVLITGNTNATELEETLKKYRLEHFLSFPNKKDNWPGMQEMIKLDKRLVIFSKTPCKNTYLLKNTVLFADFNQIENPNTCLSKPSGSNLICYNPLPGDLMLNNKDTLLLYRSFYLWNKKGQIPNFLVSSPSNLSVSVSVADSLNNTPYYKGRITCNNQPLNYTHRMMHKDVVYNGSFSIPGTSPYGNLFTPWKEGYRFYPEIVKLDENYSFQQITAIKLNLDDNLLYRFSFEKGVQNDVDQNSKDKLPIKINFRTDRQHGKVAVFNTDEAAIQCEKNANFQTKTPFTISVWVKPYNVNGSYAILSKGQIFSVKILDKGLSFERTGFVPKITNTCEIKPNVWQHLTWVYVPDYHIQFFVNGKLVDEQKIGEILEDDYAVTIGNNFSNEGFRGEMDELRIWNRALSREEIKELYLQQPAYSTLSVIYIAVAACLLVVAFYFFRRRKTKMTEIQSTPLPVINVSDDIKALAPVFRHGIFLFGPLSIINQTGDDLTTQLAPKVKQLFLLLILNKKGVSTSRINDELWPGTDEEKAKQNRNYTIQQLKKVIAKMEGVDLEYKLKNWILQVDEDVYVDLFDHDKLEQEINSGTKNANSVTNAYISVVERGKFMQGIDLEAFDPVKARISDQIIGSLLLFAENADSKLCLRLGNALLLHDSLNEDGLRLSLKALSELGRNGEAHAIYNSFCKKYKNTYNEDFLGIFSAFC